MIDFGTAVLGNLTVQVHGSSQVQQNIINLEFRILSFRTRGTRELCGWPLHYILKKSLAKQVDGVNNNRKANVLPSKENKPY